jgi:uncharacterized protein YyaL (SSP411 family)
MLYDNAQLLESFARAAAATRNREYRQAAADIVAWLEREMTGPEGGFYSAQDSESEGEEGKFYVWTLAEIEAALGPEDGQWLSKVLGATAEGNYEEERSGERTGANVLHLPRPLSEVAAEEKREVKEVESRLDVLRKKLLAARDERVRPHLDDKMIASWNGLMIGALANAGKALGEPRYVEMAKRAADSLLARLVVDGRLHRTWRAGQVRQEAFLEDYAFVARGLLDLHAATEEERWLLEARKLADRLLEEFQDEQDGGFFFTSTRHETPLARSKNLFGGGNTPLPAGVAAEVMIRLGKAPGDERYDSAARRTFDSLAGFVQSYPRSADSLLTALAMADDEPARPVAEAAPETPILGKTAKPDAISEGKPVTARAWLSQTEARKGQEVLAAVSLTIAEGWHLYGPNPEAEFVLPSTVTLAEGKTLADAEVTTPEGRVIDDPVLKQELRIYDGEVWFLIKAKVAADAPAGEATIELKIKTQACDEKQCLPPKTVSLKLPLEVTATAAEPVRHAGIFARWKRAP